ncbi:Heat shock protein 75 kDa, mitochondrial [Lamellibrachia satsuma]|nr:Heat shock protein 75 kDa, mitochondrial [Lamellibrachia satsuma]
MIGSSTNQTLRRCHVTCRETSVETVSTLDAGVVESVWRYYTFGSKMSQYEVDSKRRRCFESDIPETPDRAYVIVINLDVRSSTDSVFKMAASMRCKWFSPAKQILFYTRGNNAVFPRSLHALTKSNTQPLRRAGRLWQSETLITSLRRQLQISTRLLSAEAAKEESSDAGDEYHSIIKDTERAKGAADKHEFQAETRKLLDIVAQSLYSDKEVFIRELISNGSDSLEKLRYLQMSTSELGSDASQDVPLEIHIAVDEEKKTFTIQDTGIGMTKEELISNLGTIAKSGSTEFLQQLGEKDGVVNKNIIGQFGVGFYSTFMVSDSVDVYTRSCKPDSVGYSWHSDGLGTYNISEAEGVERGTKITLHLKGDCYDFAKEEMIKEVIKKYSNFVGVPIYLNGKKVNVIQALWSAETRDITEEMHEEFYRFISNSFDKPRFYLHYKADAPLNIRALFYVPEYKPTLFDMSRETDVAVTLYSRKVMIIAKANHILPRWLRFVKGVVDSEDIPLNLSRELLQDSALIRKLRWVLTNRLLKFFLERAKKDPAMYLKFYEDYGLFFREGIVTTPEQEQREEISKLLRFESSALQPGEMMSLDDYVSRMKAGAREIYYLSAPSRQLAEMSPYMEAMRKQDVEVLFCYEPYDELVLMNLAQFDRKNLKSIENEVTNEAPASSKPETTTEEPAETLSKNEGEDLMGWLAVTLGNKISKTKVTDRLKTHPCIITVAEMGAARHFLKTTLAGKSEEEKYRILQPTLEINLSHPIICKLNSLKNSDPTLAKLVADQVYDNALIAAGLVDDPRTMLARLNELLTRALEKH